MTIKSILHAYSGEQDEGSSLDFAIKAAQHYDAWIAGIVRHGYSKMERRIATIVSEEVHQAVQSAEQKRIREITSRFHETVNAAGLGERSSFIDIEPHMMMSISEIARCYDLVITGNHPEDEQYEFLAAYPDRIALQSGRPVIVVPDGFKAKGPARKVLVAWDGKRTIARAVGDAMAMLELGVQVTLLTVGASHTVDQHPDGGIMGLLARHDVEANHLHDRGTGRSVAETIVQTADELAVDLIIMGAYEHSKFSQDIFGGVTTEMLRSVHAPVFMAH
ncbi:universal stress protein [uncultured Cohaesibacter sp.]|uniref:universal stress protein n=1 Tax=uncultured Cohaesibacter sp. TaxID=1002546 RepID=UPI0029C9023F|nr:universal stress protein [uncultured Cohaesibacter sp.]